MKSVLLHLYDRYLDLSLHTAWIDESNGVATFPLYNLLGKIVGYQQYRPEGEKKKFNNPKEGKYFTYRKDNVVGVWGLESWNLSNTLFITEGVFDAARLTDRGYSAIAMLANDLDRAHQNWLWVVRHQRPVVAVCDNDKAGLKLAKYGTTSYIMEDDKDLGEASDQFVSDFLKDYK